MSGLFLSCQLSGSQVSFFFLQFLTRLLLFITREGEGELRWQCSTNARLRVGAVTYQHNSYGAGYMEGRTGHVPAQMWSGGSRELHLKHWAIEGGH